MEERPSSWKIGSNKGLVTGLLLVVFSLLLFMTGLHTNRWLSNVSYLILIGGIVWAHNTFKKEGDGFMSYGEGLGLGTIVAVVSGLISGIFSVIYLTWIDPTLLERTMQEEIVKMQDRGMDSAQIEQAQGFMDIMQSPFILFIISFLGFVFFGFILSLIITAFTKNTNKATF